MNNRNLTTLVGTGCLVMGMFLGYAGRLANDSLQKYKNIKEDAPRYTLAIMSSYNKNNTNPVVYTRIRDKDTSSYMIEHKRSTNFILEGKIDVRYIARKEN